MWGLLQAVEDLAQVVHLAFFSNDGEAQWLHLLVEVTVEKGGLDVHIVDLPPLLSRQRKEDTN